MRTRLLNLTVVVAVAVGASAWAADVVAPAAPAAPAVTPAAAADKPAQPAPATPAGEGALERLPNGDIRLGKITLHREAGELSFPAVLNLDAGVLEVLIATPIGRLHESLLRTEASAFHLQTLLYLIGLKNGPRLPDAEGRQGDRVNLDIEWQRADGTAVREPIEQWIWNDKTSATMQRIGWVFVGSKMGDGKFLADVEGNLALTYSVGSTVLDLPDATGDDDTVYVVNTKKKEPAKDAAVRVIVKPVPKAPKAP